MSVRVRNAGRHPSRPGERGIAGAHSNAIVKVLNLFVGVFGDVLAWSPCDELILGNLKGGLHIA